MEESIPESWVGRHVGISVLSDMGELIDPREGVFFARLGTLNHSRVLLRAVYERGILIEVPREDTGGGHVSFYPWSSVVAIAPPRE